MSEGVGPAGCAVVAGHEGGAVIYGVRRLLSERARRALTRAARAAAGGRPCCGFRCCYRYALASCSVSAVAFVRS